MIPQTDYPNQALPSRQFNADNYGEQPATSIGEQDAEEEKNLNEDYDAGELDGKKDEVIDTNPEGSPHPTPDHGLVEEGPGPDA